MEDLQRDRLSRAGASRLFELFFFISRCIKYNKLSHYREVVVSTNKVGIATIGATWYELSISQTTHFPGSGALANECAR